MLNLSVALLTLALAVSGVAVLLGLVIVRENPRQRLNWVVASILFLGGVGAALGAVDFLVSREEPKLLAAQAGLLPRFASVWEFIFPTFLLFALLFPRERAILGRFRALAWLLFLPYIVHLLLTLAGPPGEAGWSISALAGRFPFPFVQPLRWLEIVVEVAFTISAALFSLVNLAYMIAAILLLRSGLKVGVNARLRGQVQIMLAGMGGCFGLYTLAVPLPGVIGVTVDPILRTFLVVSGLAVASLSVAYSIVRYRFLDAKMIARRTILYGAASGLLLGLWVTLITRVNQIVAGFLGIETRAVETAFLVVGLVVFQPVVGRLEEWLEGLLIRDRGDYRATLRQLARDVSTVLELDELSARVVQMLEESLMVERAVLLVRPGPRRLLQRAASYGMPDTVPGWMGELGVADWPAAELPRLGELLTGAGATIDDTDAGMLVVPLQHRGERLGLLLIGSKLTGGGFNAEDRSLLSTLGDQMGIAIRNAHLHRESLDRQLLEEELRFARRVQQSFLPPSLPQQPPLEVSALNLPSRHVGGDYVDAVAIGEHEIMIAIGDVSGKGVPAALLMSMTRAALRTQALVQRSPGEILRSMNRLIHESTAPSEFVTFFLARIDRRGLRVTYSNGGHDRPLLRRRDGGIERLDRGGLLLGALSTATFEEGEVELRPGDLLVLYTDGLTEALRDGEFFGTEQLEQVLCQMTPGLSAHQVLGNLVDRCREWTGGAELDDDMTLLVLRVAEDGDAVAASLQHGV